MCVSARRRACNAETGFAGDRGVERVIDWEREERRVDRWGILTGAKSGSGSSLDPEGEVEVDDSMSIRKAWARLV